MVDNEPQAFKERYSTLRMALCLVVRTTQLVIYIEGTRNAFFAKLRKYRLHNFGKIIRSQRKPKTSSNREEADTKLLFHANHALSQDSTKPIVVLYLRMTWTCIFSSDENFNETYITTRLDKNRKILSVGPIDMTSKLKRALTWTSCLYQQ